MSNSLTKREKQKLEKNYQDFIKSMNKFLYICKCCLLGPIYTIVIIAMMILLGTFLATAILINMIINIIKSFIQGIKNLFNNTFQ